MFNVLVMFLFKLYCCSNANVSTVQVLLFPLRVPPKLFHHSSVNSDPFGIFDFVQPFTECEAYFNLLSFFLNYKINFTEQQIFLGGLYK